MRQRLPIVIIIVLIAASAFSQYPPYIIFDLNPYKINCFAKHISGDLFAGTNAGVIRSTDHGVSWEYMSRVGEHVFPLWVDKNYNLCMQIIQPYIEEPTALLVSQDTGLSWTPTPHYFSSLAMDSSGHMLAGSKKQLWESTDGGQNWSQIGVTPYFYTDLIRTDHLGNLFVASAISKNVFMSSDRGKNWTPLVFNEVGENWKITALEISSDGILLVGTSYGGIHLTKDLGKTWERPLFNGEAVYSIIADSGGNTIVAATSRNLILTLDAGETWDLNKLYWGGVNSWQGLPSIVQDTGKLIHIGTPNKGIWSSYDFGQNWVQKNISQSIISGQCIAGNPYDSTVLMGTTNGIFFSTQGDKLWCHLASTKDQNIRSVAVVRPNNLLVANGNSVQASTDFGRSWKTVLTGKSDNISLKYDTTTHIVYAYDSTGAFYKSTDYGLAWLSLGIIIPDEDTLTSVYIKNETILIGTGKGIAKKSNDKGDNWQLLPQLNAGARCVFFDSSASIVATYDDIYQYDSTIGSWDTLMARNVQWVISNAEGQWLAFDGGTDQYIWAYDDGRWKMLRPYYFPIFKDLQLISGSLYGIASTTFLWKDSAILGKYRVYSEEIDKSSIVYPNPILRTDFCYLKLGKELLESVTLVDITGQYQDVNVSRDDRNSTYMIKWNGPLPSGIYCLIIKTKSGGSIRKKVIIGQ